MGSPGDPLLLGDQGREGMGLHELMELLPIVDLKGLIDVHVFRASELPEPSGGWTMRERPPSPLERRRSSPPGRIVPCSPSDCHYPAIRRSSKRVAAISMSVSLVCTRRS